MTRRLKSAFRRFRRDEDGSAVAWGIFWSLVFLVMGAFVIDTANAYRFKAALRATADASAIAAIAAYNDPDRYQRITGDMDSIDAETRAKRAAVHLSQQNMALSRNGAVVIAADVVPGVWDGTSFDTAGVATPNAFRVTAKRTGAGGNALNTLLLGALGGFRSWDVGATAIAFSQATVRCEGGGLFSAQVATTQSTNEFRDRFCLHGELGVGLQQDNIFETGTTISMVDDTTFADGGQNTIPDGTVQESSELPLVLAESADEVIASMQAIDAGDPTSIPDFLPFAVTSVFSSSNDFTGCPVQGRVYIINDSKKFELSEGCNATEFAVVANEVVLKKNSPVTDAVIASTFLITAESESVIGSANYCTSGTYSVSMLSLGNIQMGSNGDYRGILLGAQGSITFQSDNVATDGIYGEALGDIIVQSTNDFGGCATGVSTNFNTVAGDTSGAGGQVVLVN